MADAGRPDNVPVPRLTGALAHAELAVVGITEDEQRPRFRCAVVNRGLHAPFEGFNRAKAAVIEAAILVSRLHMLPRRENRDRDRLPPDRHRKNRQVRRRRKLGRG